jgi:hypothetical protein
VGLDASGVDGAGRCAVASPMTLLREYTAAACPARGERSRPRAAGPPDAWRWTGCPRPRPGAGRGPDRRRPVGGRTGRRPAAHLVRPLDDAAPRARRRGRLDARSRWCSTWGSTTSAPSTGSAPRGRAPTWSSWSRPRPRPEPLIAALARG